MVLSGIFLGMLVCAVCSAVYTGRGSLLTGAILDGAQSGITVTLSIAGGICLWSGLSKAMEAAGITRKLARFLHPLLAFLYPGSVRSRQTEAAISGNLTANLLGLGNAATPMGIRAVKLMQKDRAYSEITRFIVMNTASVQLLPTTVAALRHSLSAEKPFDILPAVWLTSLLSVSAGLLAAKLLELWKHD